MSTHSSRSRGIAYTREEAVPVDSSEPLGYSYIRFSSPAQAEGDSLRRQTEVAVEWCARKGVQLDTSTTLHDLGTSAYTGKHRQNPDRNALAAFLQLVQRGRIPRGSYLIIENLDRLSREEEVPACHLLTSILLAGVCVVQLSPAELILTDKSPGWDVMRAVMELARGHGESAMKSERVGKAWKQKKHLARESGKCVTHMVPGWIEVKDGKLQLIPERAAIVRRIFDLAIAGYGIVSIINRFTSEGVPAFGTGEVKPGRKRPLRAGRWNRHYLVHILNDRRAVGEYQPRCRKGNTPDGPPIPDYYPAVVSEETWLAARAALEQRRTKRGRVSAHHVNVFAGLIEDARDGGAYFLATRVAAGRHSAILLNGNGAEGRTTRRSFPFPTFEAAIFRQLQEIDPREILDGVNGHDKLMQLEGEKGELEKAIATIAEELDARGESPTLYARLRAREGRLTEVLEQLARARREAANPLSQAWGEMQSLLSHLEGAADLNDALLRLRAALRRTVERIRLLVVVRGLTRMAVVQIDFTGGATRQYFIMHQYTAGYRSSSWDVHSLASLTPDAFDLSDAADVQSIEQVILRLPPEAFQMD